MELYCLQGSSGKQQREALLKETKNSSKQKIGFSFLYTVYS